MSRATQTLWHDGFMVIHRPPTQLGLLRTTQPSMQDGPCSSIPGSKYGAWVWLERPKPHSRMDLGRPCPAYGVWHGFGSNNANLIAGWTLFAHTRLTVWHGFGSNNPNLIAGWALSVHTQLTVWGMGLGRSTQIP